MNNLQIFDNAEFGSIRTVTINGEPWFVGKDVAAALGYEKARNAIAAHVDEDDALKWGITDSLGRTQDTTIINESGMYALIFGSKLESAKKFKRWVTSEVLPAIRKTGTYGYSVQSGREPEKITDNQVRVLELIVQCPSDRLPYVGMVLKASGFATSGKIAETPKKYPGQETVREFLQTTEICKRPTADVYAEYCDYCEKYNISPIPHVVFSKCVNQISDSEIIYKRISGKVKRCFM